MAFSDSLACRPPRRAHQPAWTAGKAEVAAHLLGTAEGWERFT